MSLCKINSTCTLYCATSRKVAGSIPDFFIDIILQAALWHGVDSASNRMSIKVTQSHYRPEVPREFQEFKFPRLRVTGPEWL